MSSISQLVKECFEEKSGNSSPPLQAVGLEGLKKTLCESRMNTSLSNSKLLIKLGFPLDSVNVSFLPEFYSWQYHCLLHHCEKKHNLLIKAPTSAGKSCVAELMAYRTLINKSEGRIRCKPLVLYILPLVALVQKKKSTLQKCFTKIPHPSKAIYYDVITLVRGQHCSKALKMKYGGWVVLTIEKEYRKFFQINF